jgi:hypothetical protein
MCLWLFYVLFEKVGQVDLDVSMGGEMLCPIVSFLSFDVESRL